MNRFLSIQGLSGKSWELARRIYYALQLPGRTRIRVSVVNTFPLGCSLVHRSQFNRFHTPFLSIILAPLV